MRRDAVEIRNCEYQFACCSPLRAGKAHDVMALKCRGQGSPLNFGLDEYGDLVPMLPQLSKARACQAAPAALLHVLLISPWAALHDRRSGTCADEEGACLADVR